MHYGGPFGGPSNYSSRTLFPGAVTLLLGTVALVGRHEWRRKLPFALFAFIGIQAPLGLWPVHDVLAIVPPFSNLTNSRLIGLLCLGIAVLAAFGLQEVLDAPGALRRARGVAVAGLGAVVVAFLAVGPSSQVVRLTGHHLRTGTDPPQPAVIQLTAVAWLAVAAVGFAAAVAASKWLGRRTLAAALVGLALVDLGHFAWGYQSTAPRNQVYPPITNALAFLRAHAGAERVTALGNALPPDTGMVWKLRDIRGYDPPAPDKRFMRLFRVANPVQSDISYLSIPLLTLPGRHVLDVLGARWVLTDPAAPVDPRVGLTPGYRAPDGLVYRNPNAVPRAFVPGRVVTASGVSALRRIAARDFAAREEALVPSGGIRAGDGFVRTLDQGSARVALTARMRRGGLVVLADVLDDGWRVRVDGRSAEAVRVDTVLRGVQVPAGAHRVTWTYRVPGLTAGLALTLLGLAAGFAWGSVLLIRARGRKAGSPGSPAMGSGAKSRAAADT